jgi:asparagine synthetase B (glutamine-hydrolysing)
MLAGMAAFHHRGPNGQRYWMAHDCRVALGHTRLSIIDRCSIYGLVTRGRSCVVRGQQ